MTKAADNAAWAKVVFCGRFTWLVAGHVCVFLTQAIKAAIQFFAFQSIKTVTDGVAQFTQTDLWLRMRFK